MSTVVVPGGTAWRAAFTELEEVTVEVMDTSDCHYLLSVDHHPSPLVGNEPACSGITLTPDRWGDYTVVVQGLTTRTHRRWASKSGSGYKFAGAFETYEVLEPTETIVHLSFWPVAFEAVVGEDLGLPFAGVHQDIYGSKIALYANAMTNRAGAWYTAASAATAVTGDARALSSDGVTFVDHDGSFGGIPDNKYDASATLELAGLPRVHRLGRGAYLLHGRYGAQDGTADNFLLRWKGTAVTSSSSGWASQTFELASSPIDWEADAFDGKQIGTYHSIIEDLGTSRRMVLAYGGDLSPGGDGTGVDTTRILHADVGRTRLGATTLGSFYRPEGINPASNDPAVVWDDVCLDASGAPVRSSLDPFGFWCGTATAGHRADTPWFIPDVVTPFGTDSLRLTALYQAGPDTGEPGGWASWRREVGAGEDSWEFEGVLLSYDQIHDGLLEAGEVGDDDFTCLMGDHTIVNFDGETFLYVGVEVFRGFYEPEPPTSYDDMLERFVPEVLAFEANLVEQVEDDVANAVVVSNTGDSGSRSEKVEDLLIELGLATIDTTSTRGTVTSVDFDCRWCLAYDDGSGNHQLGVVIEIDEDGNVTSVSLDVDPIAEGYVLHPCRITPFEGFGRLAAQQVTGDATVEQAAHYGDSLALLCWRYCMRRPLILASSRAVS